MKPKLRFKDFTDEWKKTTIKEISEINPKNEPLPDNFIYIDLESVNNGILTQKKYISKLEAPSRAQRTIRKNDILFQTVRPYQQNNYFVDKIDDIPYVASTGYALIRTNENPYFLYSLLHKKTFLDTVINRCTGTSFPAISASDLETINISIPTIEEQNKIAITLQLLSKKIEKQSRKIDELKKYKVWLINTIYNNPEWKTVKLGDILSISDIKNKEGLCNKNDVLSVSDEYGVVNQIELQGRSFAASNVSNYKIVKKNQIIYTRSPLASKPYGIIKIVDKYEGIVSPLYIVNDIKDGYDPHFIYYMFDLPNRTNNYLKPLVRMGAKHTMNISDNEWLSGEVQVPSFEKQKTIAKMLLLFDKKIKLEVEKYECLTQYKNKLIQEMIV